MFSFFFIEIIGPAADGPAGPAPAPLHILDTAGGVQCIQRKGVQGQIATKEKAL